jgi:hypothetical protein
MGYAPLDMGRDIGAHRLGSLICSGILGRLTHARPRARPRLVVRRRATLMAVPKRSAGAEIRGIAYV